MTPDAGTPSDARGNAARTPVSQIMTETPLCVRPDLTLDRLLPLLVDENIGGVPVVDSHGRPLGMVSKTDLLAEEADRADAESVEREFPPVAQVPLRLTEELLARRTAGELMSTPLLSLRDSDSILRAAQLMTTRAVHRLGVVDDEGRLVGVVSTTDVVRWLAEQTEE
jgi:CBS domain-containing protein